MTASRSGSSAGNRRGGVIVLGGPDGAGKTTMSDLIVGDVLAGREVLHVRFPRLLPRRNRSKAREARLGPGGVPDPMGERIYPVPYSPWVSVLKTLYLYCDFLLGWTWRVRPALGRGGWVVFERGWWDHAVDPRRYRLRSGHLFKLLGNLLPSPDVVFLLEAQPKVIRGRKPQLSSEELARQMEAWREVLPARQRRVYLDASLPPEELTEQVRRELSRLLNGGSGGTS